MVITQVGLGHMFVPFYLTVTLTGIIAAIIVPRIPPLSRKSNTYINGSAPKKDMDTIPAGYNAFTYGLEKAVEKAESNSSVKVFFADGIKNVIDMWLGVLPIVIDNCRVHIIL